MSSEGTPLMQPEYDYMLVFAGTYDVNVVLNSGVPDAGDSTFQAEVESKVSQILTIFQFQRGINKMNLILNYNNSVYLISVDRV
jgi:hypothetical protein